MLFDQNLTPEKRQEELKAFLAPLSAEQPAGPDLRTTPEGKALTKEIESRFRGAITAEKNLENYRLLPDENSSPPPEPQWNEFLNEASEFLSNQSRDLLVATFFAEASIREYGMRGLLVGLELMTGLVENFGMNVNPPQDPDSTKDRRFAAWRHAYDWTARLAPRLESLCKLTSSGTTFAQYAESVKLDDPQLKFNIREARIQAGAKTTETIRSEIRQGEAYFKNLFSDLLGCRNVLKKLNQLASKSFVSPDPNLPIPLPDFTSTSESITRMISKVKGIASPGLLPDENDSGPTAAAVGNGQPSAVADAQPNPGQMVATPAGQMTREAAFTQLQHLADFFRRTEPHSPISYSIEQTIRWGKMSLPELFAELVADSGSRKTLFERTGLPMSDPEPK